MEHGWLIYADDKLLWVKFRGEISGYPEPGDWSNHENMNTNNDPDLQKLHTSLHWLDKVCKWPHRTGIKQL